MPPTMPRLLLMARLAAASLAVIGDASIASGQGLLPGQRLSVEVIGGTLDVQSPSALPKIGGAIYAPLQKDSVGKPCLHVSPISQRQIINQSIYDHILLLDNNCGQEIRIQACYYKTDSCKTLSIGGYKRQQQLLGVFPAADFRFSYREYVK